LIRLDTINWQWVLRLAVVLLAVAFLPMILGLLLDRALHTFPVITLFMMLLGLNLGIFTIARNVSDMYARAAAAPSQSPPIGGDQC